MNAISSTVGHTWSEVGGTIAANLFVQSTLIMAGGLLLARCCRGRGSVVQSAILRGTLLSVLACPIVAAVLQVAGLRAVEFPFSALSNVDEAKPVLDPADSGRDSVAQLDNSVVSSVAGSTLADVNPTAGPMPEGHAIRESLRDGLSPQQVESDRSEPAHAVAASAAEALNERPNWIARGGLLWIVVGTLLVLRWLFAHWVLWRARLASAPVAALDNQACRAAARTLGTPVPGVRRSRLVTSPCLVGWWRPTIFVPFDAGPVSHAVFFHELAHLRRRDCLWQSTASLLTAILWFQPLVWRLRRRVEEVADEVCDDIVVSLSDRGEYARILLRIAESWSAPQPARLATVGVARYRSQIGKRIHRILDVSTQRSTRLHVLQTAAVVVLACAGTVTASRFAAIASNASDASRQASASRDGAESTGRSTASKPGERENSKSRTSSADGADKDDVAKPNRPVLKGRVVDTDGQPVSGAPIYDRLGDNWTLRQAATTNADGAFSYEVPIERYGPRVVSLPGASMRVGTVLPGKAINWSDVPLSKIAETNVELRLADEHRIKGRLLNTDGQPIREVTVAINDIRRLLEHSIAEYVASLKNDLNPQMGRYSMWEVPPPGYPASVVSDAHGNFELGGLPDNCVVQLSLGGRNIHNGDLIVVLPDQRQVGGTDDITGPIRLTDGRTPSAFLPRFTYVAPPHRTLLGTVVDHQTGDAIPDVRLRAFSNNKRRIYSDKNGKFTIAGCLRRDEYRIVASTSDQRYFMRDVSIADEPGQGDQDVTITLVRGLQASGRVLDSDDRPVDGSLKYFPLFPNPHTETLGTVAYPCSQVRLRADGSYALPVLPGPGILVMFVTPGQDEDYTVPQIDLEALKALVGNKGPTDNSTEFVNVDAGGGAMQLIGLRHFRAIQLINPPDDTDSLKQDLRVERGRKVEARVIDPDGKPVAGARVSGQSHSLAVSIDPLPTPAFTVRGLRPDEKRVLLVYLPSRDLAARVVVEGNRAQPLDVRLQRCGTVTGRVVDEQDNDRPVSDLKVFFNRGGLFGTETWSARTNKKGEFTIRHLIPNEPYDVTVELGQGIRILTRGVTVSVGEQLDVGVLERTGGRRPKTTSRSDDSGNE